MAALDVDETIAQLLASEGFSSVEELAYIDVGEIASIQGFDDETAAEIQQRATDYLDAIERAHDEERKTLGVEDELYEIPGLTAAMLVALGKEGIKTVEDFAGCAADDLVGWTERKDGETKRFDGTFKDFPVSREEAEEMIMQARLKAGWITEADLRRRRPKTCRRKERPHNAGDHRPGAAARRNSNGNARSPVR